MAQLTSRKFALGLDFGTESVRVLAVDCERGVEAAEAVVRYPHAVITDTLPSSGAKLPPDFALQHAQDYIDSAVKALREVLTRVPAAQVSGIGVDFTACTILPIRKDGTPLMFEERFRANPHAWVKLWKHHAAQPEAERIVAHARDRMSSDGAFLKFTGGTVSSEWMLPKCWEVARHAPEVYAEADVFIDAGDWFVQQMTGAFTRNSCAAGYKGHWSAEQGFPSQEFLTRLDPKLSGLRDKWLNAIHAPGAKAGAVSKRFAELSGLQAGTPVSAATIDAHSGVAGMGVYREGSLSIIMGTSSCHMAISRELKLFEGCAGVVSDGIIPGFYGYESGQAAVGDLFGWFAREFMGASFADLSTKAAELVPGESGLIALDWMNGSRTPIMNANLSGMILGLTLDSKPHEVYRALIEATAFGTRQIVETHQNAGIPIRELVVCGGLTQDPLILQIYADVTGLPVKVAASNQAVALGAAIFGALAAGQAEGGFGTMEEAITKMTAPHRQSYEPNAAHRQAYDALFAVYRDATEHYGRTQSLLMKQLKELKKAGAAQRQTKKGNA